MTRSVLLVRFAFAALVAIIGSTWALADSSDIPILSPPDVLHNFRFITSHSTVEQSGGLPPYTIDWNVAGKFGLSVGFNHILTPTPTATPPAITGRAAFVNVDAYLFHPQSAGPASAIALDLDSVLNLTGLKGTFQVPTDLHFSGDDDQGIPIQMEAVIHGPLVHITGATLPVPTCATCGINMYKIDAYAFLGPFADFNLDGTIDRKDLQILMSNRGMRSGATFEQGDANGDGAVDGSDFLLWQPTLGATTSLSAFSDLSTSGAIRERTKQQT